MNIKERDRCCAAAARCVMCSALAAQRRALISNCVVAVQPHTQTLCGWTRGEVFCMRARSVNAVCSIRDDRFNVRRHVFVLFQCRARRSSRSVCASLLYSHMNQTFIDHRSDLGIASVRRFVQVRCIVVASFHCSNCGYFIFQYIYLPRHVWTVRTRALTAYKHTHSIIGDQVYRFHFHSHRPTIPAPTDRPTTTAKIIRS